MLMKFQLFTFILLASELFSYDNACRQPYKYNMGVSPFYANRHVIDSMVDATGFVVSYKYDNNGRVVESTNPHSGKSTYTYRSNNSYTAFEENSNLVIEYYDNDNSGTDSVVFSSESNFIMKTNFRYNNSKDVFENWESRDDLEPVTYDSIQYLPLDSLFHYRYYIYNQVKYEFSEGCKSKGTKCECVEIFKSPGFPIRMSPDPIYEYNNEKLVSRKNATIYYPVETNYSSSFSSSSSEYDISSSSAPVSLKKATSLIIQEMRNKVEYYLNGKIISK